jgi:hypothetical protein
MVEGRTRKWEGDATTPNIFAIGSLPISRARRFCGATICRHPMFPSILIQIATLLFGLLAGLTSFAQVQTPSSPPASEQAVWHFRFDLFQMLLEHNGLKPVDSYEQALVNSHKTVFVFVGRPEVSSRDLQIILNNGGAVLFATDAGVRLNGLFQLSPGSLEARKSYDRYQSYADCLRVSNLDHDHSAMHGVKELIVNRSGKINRLHQDSGTWQTIARLPKTTLVDDPGDSGLIAVYQPKHSHGGRMMLVADHSLLTNGMMWHGDNAIFAVNAGRWLCESSVMKPEQVFFMVHGVAQDSYLLGPLASHLPTPPINGPPPPLTLSQQIEVANALVKTVEDSNVLNEMTTRWQKNLPQHIYWRTVLQLLTAILVLIGVFYLLKNTRRIIQFRPAPEAASALEISRSAREESLRQVEAIRILARNFCIDMTSSTNPDVWHQKLAVESASATARLSSTQRKDLAEILALADNKPPGKINRKRTLELVRRINELKAQIENGIRTRGPHQSTAS